MSDLNSTNLLSALTSSATSPQKTSSLLSSNLNDSFAQILNTSLMSSGTSSPFSSGDSSSLFGGSSSAMSLLLPLMLMLLEQITAEQTTEADDKSAGQEETSAVTSGQEVQTVATKSTENTSGDNAEPVGRPVGGVLTQYYHKRHFGLDFGVPVGTPVKSTQAGKVVYSGWNNEGYGNLVIVENGPYRTYYAHLSGLPLNVGDQVSAGQVIGLSGNTGNSTGPHLHYEIRINRVPIDPTGRTLNSGGTW